MLFFLTKCQLLNEFNCDIAAHRPLPTGNSQSFDRRFLSIFFRSLFSPVSDLFFVRNSWLLTHRNLIAALSSSVEF